MGFHKKYSQALLSGMAVLVLAGGMIFFHPQKSYALAVCVPPAGCPVLNIPPLIADINTQLTKFHKVNRNFIMDFISQSFQAHENWLTGDFFKNKIKPTMQGMTQQLSAVSMQQVALMGMFLDAKQQLETQRLFQELQAEAQRDYQPSEDFCWFGTAARSLSASENTSRFRAAALDARQMKRHLRHTDLMGSEDLTADKDKLLRFDQFVKKYCDPADNNFSGTDTGLSVICPAQGPRPNMDIDYTRLVEDRRTLDAEFKPGTVDADAQDILAMGNNLYGHTVMNRYSDLSQAKNQDIYMALRALVARRNVAENSFNSIVAMKSSGSDPMAGAAATSGFLGALLKELGVPDNEIFQMIGEKPSHYAQLEILAKKIYQNPDFFANLYDTPANVARKGVALKAIELMLDRAIYESQVRQEMVTSVLLAQRLRGQMERAGSRLSGGRE
ncbi:MAG: hypothetical protein ACT4OY_03865 [Alphaproteobacteria bacterium]